MIQITDTIVLKDREVKERFVRATGARGQNANKEATAVDAAKPPKTRKRARPRRAAREDRLISKHRHGAIKRSRSGRDED